MTNDALPIRIERVRPVRSVRRVRSSSEWAADHVDPGSHGAALALHIDDIEGEGRSFMDTWARIRVLWDQTTFFLFSADSWRR